MGKLNLDQKTIDRARTLAEGIADRVQAEIEQYTTVAVERTVVRLLGVDGVDEDGVPYPNLLVERIKETGGLPGGAAVWVGAAMASRDLSAQEVAEQAAAARAGPDVPAGSD
ncbi:D-lysine 5,6-aminomutase subunit alpha, partial [Candidatus Bipolaricaulota bacterium]|nr:D-lysine 5,6-aminomutase subunit alpha [Candidatus Bipolaricaulota bacterium]